MKHFNKYLEETTLDVKMEYLAEQQLLALQGKGAKDVAKRLIPGIDFSTMPFMSGVIATVAGAVIYNLFYSDLFFFLILSLLILLFSY